MGLPTPVFTNKISLYNLKKIKFSLFRVGASCPSRHWRILLQRCSAIATDIPVLSIARQPWQYQYLAILPFPLQSNGDVMVCVIQWCCDRWHNPVVMRCFLWCCVGFFHNVLHGSTRYDGYVPQWFAWCYQI